MKTLALILFVILKLFLIFSEEVARREVKPFAQAPEGEGCPRCGGFVYAAEQMLARGRVSLSLIKIWNNNIVYRTWNHIRDIIEDALNV